MNEHRMEMIQRMLRMITDPKIRAWYCDLHTKYLIQSQRFYHTGYRLVNVVP